MALDFPDNPLPGDIYTFGAKSWTWDGEQWNLTSPSSLEVRIGVAEDAIDVLESDVDAINANLSANYYSKSASDARFLNLAGVSGLSELAAAPAADDWFVVHDTSDSTPLKKISPFNVIRTASHGLEYFGRATASTWTNNTATLSDITASTGPSPAATLALSTDRYYRAVFHATWGGTVASDIPIVVLTVDGVDLTLQAVVTGVLTGNPEYRFEYVFVPTTGASVVHKMRGRRSAASSGTVNLTATAANRPMTFYIEDVGAA